MHQVLGGCHEKESGSWNEWECDGKQYMESEAKVIKFCACTDRFNSYLGSLLGTYIATTYRLVSYRELEICVYRFA